MKKNYNNLIISSILLALSIFILTGCQKEKEASNINNNTTLEQQNNNSNDKDILTSNTETQKLTINNKCVGCRKCTMIAPKVFAMNGKKAVIISQEYTNSDNIQNAINKCPVDAIELIEI